MKKFSKVASTTAAFAAAATGMNLGTSADAAVITQSVSIPIPATVDGVYLNVVTLQQSTVASFAGFDINIYSTSGATGGTAFFTSTASSATAANRGVVAATSTGAALNLTSGSVVGPAATYNTGVSTSAANFPAGSTGTVGIRFFNEAAAALNYGYLTFTAPSSSTAAVAGLITSISYENTGAALTVGVPEPASMSLLALGAVGALRRRRVA